MNQELLQFYIQGISKGWFYSDSYTGWFESVSNTKLNAPNEFKKLTEALEKKLGRQSSNKRKQNPEFQAALEIMHSPLMKALR